MRCIANCMSVIANAVVTYRSSNNPIKAPIFLPLPREHIIRLSINSAANTVTPGICLRRRKRREREHSNTPSKVIAELTGTFIFTTCPSPYLKVYRCDLREKVTGGGKSYVPENADDWHTVQLTQTHKPDPHPVQ